MDFTSQVETREIADADLDNVSGGLLGGVIHTVTGPVEATVYTVEGTVQGLTGVNLNAAVAGSLSVSGL